MSFPIKPHLPLITNRLEFVFNSLPPPPQITTRRDLGANIRRQARHDSKPYSRPRPHEKTPVRAQPVRSDLESDSSLSDLSSSEDSNGENTANSELIPKPVGEAGKVNSGGFNLEKELGWNKKRFSDFTNHIRKEVDDKLDIKQCFTNQKSADIDQIIQSTARKFKIKNKYANYWPIREALKARLKYTADWEKKKEARKIGAELKEVFFPLKKNTRSNA